MTHFDDCLNSIDDTKQGDIVRQAIVVLMGSLAKHMESTDPKVNNYIIRCTCIIDTCRLVS